MLICAIVVIVALALISRPLLFATIDPIAARARGLPTLLLSVSFMLILAVAVAMCVLTIGALLALSLLVAPPAAALRVSRRPNRALALSVLFGLVVAWGGILASFVGPWKHPPIGFSISSLGAIVYLSAYFVGKRRRSLSIREGEHPGKEVVDEGR